MTQRGLKESDSFTKTCLRLLLARMAQTGKVPSLNSEVEAQVEALATLVNSGLMSVHNGMDIMQRIIEKAEG